MHLINYHPNQENALQRFIRSHRAYIQKDSNNKANKSNLMETIK